MKCSSIISRLLAAVLATVTFLSIQAQDTLSSHPMKKKKQFESNTAILFAPIYTAQFPFGNMQARYGFNSLFGFSIAYKMKKNWLIGLEGNFLFGTKVRDSYILNHIAMADGKHISQNGDLLTVNLQERGYSLKFNFGKVIPFTNRYPDAGLLWMTGVGLLQHKIAIDVKASSLPQLDKTYRKGYDRMCNGPVISQFLGGIFLARNRFISAYAGVQFDVGFTQNRRAFDFYNMQKLSEKRIDMFLGIRVGWIIPYFLQSSEREYYYY